MWRLVKSLKERWQDDDIEFKLGVQEISLGLVIATSFGVWWHSFAAGLFAFLVWMRKFSA